MERILKKSLSKIREEQAIVSREIRERTVGYILAAFSFVAGLAWNEAIKSFIEQFFPQNANGFLLKFIYAFLVTVVVVIVTIYLVRVIEKKEEVNNVSNK